MLLRSAWISSQLPLYYLGFCLGAILVPGFYKQISEQSGVVNPWSDEHILSDLTVKFDTFKVSEIVNEKCVNFLKLQYNGFLELHIYKRTAKATDSMRAYRKNVNSMGSYVLNSLQIIQTT